MESYTIDGGTVSLTQTVYLDFDGELTSYNGELMTIDGVEVAHSNLDAARIAAIIANLNDMFAARGAIFTSVKPEGGEYSTVFVGKTGAFAEIGDICGIAETIDEGNLNKKDNAFVLLDATALNSDIVNTIAHEVGHLLGDRHAGDGINAYLGGTLYITNGQTSTGLILSSANTTYTLMGVRSGGTANGTIIRDGGAMIVSANGVAHNTVISAYGSQHVSSGGVVSGTVIAGGFYGQQFISSGGIARNTTVSSGGMQWVSSGGWASNTDLASGGSQHVVAGGGTYFARLVNNSLQTLFGSAIGTTILSNCMQYVSSGGNARITYVGMRGAQYVGSGGRAESTHISSGGAQYVYSTGVSLSARISNGGEQVVSGGGVASDTVISGGTQHVYSGATEIGTVINGGTQRLNSGVRGSNTVVSRGEQLVLAGASTYGITVYIGGSQTVYTGGIASSSHISGGIQNISGGTSLNTEIYSAGVQYMFSGGADSGATIFSGGAQVVSSGGLARDVDIYSGGAQYVSSGGSSLNTGIYSGGAQYVSSGGTDFRATVSSGGVQYVYGGIASSGSFYFGAIQYVMNLGEAREGTIRGGQHVRSGGLSLLQHIGAGGSQHISSGGIASRCVISSGGHQRIYDGGIAITAHIVYSGRQVISYGGLADNAIVYSGGTQYISAGGTANDAFVYSGGTQYISAAGAANDAIIYSGGLQVIYADGIARNAKITGIQRISAGGTASNTIVSSHGEQHVSSGGSARYNIIRSGGAQHLFYGGSSFDSVVEYGGVIRILGGSTILGGTTNIAGSLITEDYTVNLNNAHLIYNLIGRKATDGVIVDKQSNLTNWNTLNIHVVSTMAAGDYKLAGGAAAFNSGMNLSVDGVLAGTLSLGSSLTVGGMTYVLSKSAANVLSLSITNANTVDWPPLWMGPSTAKPLSEGVIGAYSNISGSVYAVCTESGKSYTNVAFDTSLPTASFFARVSAGTIGTFRGGDYKNFFYMTGGAVTTLYAGVGTSATNMIQIDGGTVGTLYGGGSGGATLAETIIAGGNFTNVNGGSIIGHTRHVYVGVSGGTISRVRCGADSGGSVGHVDADIISGTITGQIVGGGLGNVTGNITLNIGIDSPTPIGAYIYGGSIGGNVSGNIYLNITKGVYQGIIVAGSRAAAGANVTVNGFTCLNFVEEGVAHISNPLAIAAKVDTAWIFGGQAISGGKITLDATSLFVAGGASVKYFVGGGAADGAGSVATVKDVYMDIYGAIVTGGIWGAGYAYNGGVASADKVFITIISDATNVTSISGDINTGGIVLGSSGSVSYDTGTITFAGSGDYLNFSKTVDGSGAATSSMLVFNNFTGGFNGTITNFERVVFSGNTSVNINNAYTDCRELVFDLSWRYSADAVVTSMDSFQFGAGSDNYVGLVIDANASGEITTELMGVSDISALEGVRIALLDSYDATTFIDTFDIGEVYYGIGFEVAVNYDSDSGVLYSLFSAT